ncbi:MAG: peptidoglycan editing factor PgeF [Pelolinea sp.]|nr:peptidoglycan editing factor PgeF [Pelolinea sp.]
MRRGGCSLEPWDSLNLATSVGDSRAAVIENRRRITEILKLEDNSIYDVWQVHSNRVISTDQPRGLDIPHLKADAIITGNPDVTLLMLFADCVPIMFYDPEKDVAAIAHAGWQGTVNGVVIETVKKLQTIFGTDPKNLIVCIGPSIRVDHYEVGQDVEKEIKNSFIETEEIIIKQDGKIFLDLQNANRFLLKQYGVKNIFISKICTACNAQDWFSHRAENGKTGRFAVVMTVHKRKDNEYEN